MSELRALVCKGRLVMDVPTDLPDGTVLNLVVDDEGDHLNDDERRVLNDTISRAWASVQAGRVHSAQDVLEKLRRRRA